MGNVTGWRVCNFVGITNAKCIAVDALLLCLYGFGFVCAAHWRIVLEKKSSCSSFLGNDCVWNRNHLFNSKRYIFTLRVFTYLIYLCYILIHLFISHF